MRVSFQLKCRQRLAIKTLKACVYWGWKREKTDRRQMFEEVIHQTFELKVQQKESKLPFTLVRHGSVVNCCSLFLHYGCCIWEEGDRQIDTKILILILSFFSQVMGSLFSIQKRSFWIHKQRGRAFASISDTFRWEKKNGVSERVRQWKNVTFDCPRYF